MKNRAFFAAAIVLTASIVTLAQTTDAATANILRRAMSYQYQFRAGRMDIIPEYVAMLEEATKTNPENADLAYAMGVAYLAQGARAMLPGGNPAEAMPAMQKGPAALERALQLNPNHPEALAIRGGIRSLMGSLTKAPAVTVTGVAEMNRAIELAPTSRRVRLSRAFLGINLPDAMRNRTAEAEDLDFLITVANGTRAGDYIRIMRGDLDVETGHGDLAREQYQTVVTSTSPAAAEAKARLAALDQGGVLPADIKKLRQAAGSNCLMCHGT